MVLASSSGPSLRIIFTSKPEPQPSAAFPTTDARFFPTTNPSPAPKAPFVAQVSPYLAAVSGSSQALIGTASWLTHILGPSSPTQPDTARPRGRHGSTLTEGPSLSTQP